MGDLLIGLLGCIPRFRTTMLETGGIVNLVFKIQIKVLVLWNELFCVYNCACSVQCWEDLGCLALGCTRWGFFFSSVGVSGGSAWISDLLVEHGACFSSLPAFWSCLLPAALPCLRSPSAAVGRAGGWEPGAPLELPTGTPAQLPPGRDTATASAPAGVGMELRSGP